MAIACLLALSATALAEAGVAAPGDGGEIAVALASISGNVTADSTGLFIPNIRVDVYWSDGTWEAMTWTSGNGDYFVGGLEPGDYKVGFKDVQWWDGWYAREFYDGATDVSSAATVTIGSGEQKTGIDVSLADGGPSITGTVRDVDTSALLEDVYVTAYYYADGESSWVSASWAYTNADGYYELVGLDYNDLLPDRGYRVGFEDLNGWAGGYQAEFYDDVLVIDDATDLYPTPLVPEENIDASLSPVVENMSITGTVRDAATSDPLEEIDVTVWAYGGSDWYDCEYSYTDELGEYAVWGLEPGDYKVGFEDYYSGDGWYEPEFYDDAVDVSSATTVTVTAGVPTTGIDAMLTEGVVSITGTVTDEDDEPLGEIDVAAYEFDGDWYDIAWTWTDWDGSYELYGLGTGTYRVGFEDYWGYGNYYYATEYWDNKTSVETASDIPTVDGTPVPDIDAVLAVALPELSGLVKDVFTGEPVDANVELYVGTDLLYVTETDWDGLYQIRDLDANAYKLVFSAWGYQDIVVDPFEPDGSSQYTQDCDMMPLDPDIYGTVRNINTNAPIYDAYIELSRWEGYWGWWDTCWTNTDGTYELFYVEPGYYKITAWAEGHAEWSTGVIEFTGDSLVQNIWLSPDYTPSDTGEPVYGRTRYSTSVKIAEQGFDPDGDGSWPGVTDIILSSGEDRASADPLSASGLCYAYEAPLFLVSSTGVSDEVKLAVKEITQANGTVDVHIVGGPVSVPDARFNELNAYTGGKLKKDRILSTGSRYDLAVAVAYRIGEVTEEPPEVILVANGADSTKFFDALALSPISARNGYPILLVSADDIPLATDDAIWDLWPDRIIVGGGPNTVSEDVVDYLEAERWYGSSRYTTAITIANNAIGEGWLSDRVVGVAAKLPDALTGGSLVGRMNGVLLLTKGDVLTPETRVWLEKHEGNIENCFVFGGPNSVLIAVRTAISAALK